MMNYTDSVAGNALARVQGVHEPAELGTSPFAPPDFKDFSTMCTH